MNRSRVKITHISFRERNIVWFVGFQLELSNPLFLISVLRNNALQWLCIVMLYDNVVMRIFTFRVVMCLETRR